MFNVTNKKNITLFCQILQDYFQILLLNKQDVKHGIKIYTTGSTSMYISFLGQMLNVPATHIITLRLLRVNLSGLVIF